MTFQDFIANNITAKLSLSFKSVDGIPWRYKKYGTSVAFCKDSVLTRFLDFLSRLTMLHVSHAPFSLCVCHVG